MKKVVSILLTIALLTGMFPSFGESRAKAAATITNAISYTIGDTRSGVISKESEEQYYQFSLPTSGKIDLTGSAYLEQIQIRIYDANAEEVTSSRPGWNSTSQVIPLSETRYLTAGTYYLMFQHYSGYGNYNFSIAFTSTEETFKESQGGSNNSMAAASGITTDGTKYIGQIADNDVKDFYKFTLAQSGRVDLNATFYGMEHIYWVLYDEAGEKLLDGEPWWNGTTNNIVLSEGWNLTSGTYYIVFSESYSNRGKYDFSLSFTSAGESYPEGNGGANNTTTAASSIEIGKVYTGQIAVNDEKDFYAFTLSSKRSVVYQVAAKMYHIEIKLYDAAGNQLWDADPYWNSTNEQITWSKNEVLNAGKYYLSFDKYSAYGVYQFAVSYITQDNCNHEYKDTYHSSTYFSKGYTEHTCQWCGHSYKTDYTAKKKLSQGYFYRYGSRTGKNKAILSWSQIYDASGYQIRYCRKSSMSSGVKVKTVRGASKTKATINGLGRKKKWYFQVRAYKTSGGQTVYGKWSGRMWVKTL